MAVYIKANQTFTPHRLLINKLLTLLVLTFSVSVQSRPETVNLLPSINDFSTHEHREKIQDWLNFIKNSQNHSPLEKLRLTNDYFNQRISFISDQESKQTEDHWSTPVETILSQQGDCEDFATAKYITLLALGIDESKVRMMYVKALDINQAHMVVIYNETKDSNPLVLDNIIPDILPANRRADLKPVYSFNSQGLWLTKRSHLGKKIEQKQGFSPWERLLERIQMGQ